MRWLQYSYSQVPQFFTYLLVSAHLQERHNFELYLSPVFPAEKIILRSLHSILWRTVASLPFRIEFLARKTRS